MTQPFICIITPIFDGAINSLKLLVPEIQSQSFSNFIHVSISNGPSPIVQTYLKSLHDARFIYDEIPEENTYSLERLMISLGKRRNYCLEKYNAERYVFLDADLLIVDKDYFQKLHQAHHETKADVILVQVRTTAGTILPKFNGQDPGDIDISNYTFSQKVARSRPYPMNVDPFYGRANDWRYFNIIRYFPMHTILEPFAIKDGNSTYKRVSELE